jgi:hypothetical protein
MYVELFGAKSGSTSSTGEVSSTNGISTAGAEGMTTTGGDMSAAWRNENVGLVVMLGVATLVL